MAIIVVETIQGIEMLMSPPDLFDSVWPNALSIEGNGGYGKSTLLCFWMDHW